MRKNHFGTLGLGSVLLATLLIGIEPQVAMACSGSASSSSGLSHGSSLGSGSVTVCVGSGGSSAGSVSTQTITKTVRVKVPQEAPPPKKVAKPATKPAAKPASKAVSKPAPKPVAVQPVSCPSSSQLASMPRSADAAERWAESLCSSSKPAPVVQKIKPAPKPKQKYRTVTIVETIETETEGSFWNQDDQVSFFPNPLVGSVYPSKVLRISQVANFSSNPSSHFGVAEVLGRQAQVHFVPVRSGWIFSDGSEKAGADVQHAFGNSGKFQATAYVYYAVSYRLLGESTWQAVGELLVQSETLELTVGALGLKADDKTQGALLVGQDCLEKPRSFGCQL